VANPYYGKVTEQVVNVKLAEILSESFGIDARAERARGRRRPDIRCYYRGLIIGIEASYSKSDAEKDAMRRIEEGLVDIALALWLKRSYPDVPESELKEIIKKSRFDVKVFVPEEVIGPLIPYLEETLKRRAEPATGWFVDVDLPMIKTILENSIGYLLREEEVRQLLEDMKLKISDFTKSLARIDEKVRERIRERVYNILYKLYGLSVAEAKDPEVVFGQTALSILLSTTFYEHIRSRHPELIPISEYVRRYGYLEGLKKAFEDLLKIDYETAVETTIKLLNALPPDIILRVKDLVDLGIKIASNRSLLRRDFAGRIYHGITGDIALRKGFATFYTEVPAAYLLATLATEALLEIDEKSIFDLSEEEARNIIRRIKKLNIGDLACGSGTLLTASYYSLMRIASALKYYYDLDIDLVELGKELIEKHIYGIDALKYASQITAINLALIGPSIISKENVHTSYLGYMPDKNKAWLGSLELFNNGKKVGTLLAWLEGWYEGGIERVSVEGVKREFSIPEKFELIIMNPPFTRPTYRGKKMVPEEKRAFFGFISDETVREKLRERYSELLREITSELRIIARSDIETELRDMPIEVKEIIKGERDEKLRQYLNIGLAGEALPFLFLAYKYLNNDGILAFVLPRASIAGVSWFLIRVLLSAKFHLKYVITSTDPENGYNFSEGASLSEALIIAKRVSKHETQEKTIFVNIIKKPRTLLEGVMLAEEIKRAIKERRISVSLKNEGPQCIIYEIDRGTLLRYIDNWNRFVAIPDSKLSEYVLELLEKGEIFLGNIRIKIPLTRLERLLKTIYLERKRGKKSIKVPVKGIGIDAHQFYELYTKIAKSPYQVLWGTEEKYRLTMRIRPNAYVAPKSKTVEDKAINTFNAYAGKILIPGVNVRWNTSHVIVLYCNEKLLSNTHYAINLNVEKSMEKFAEKALVLWFNTTWGLLSILINREETEGPWAQIKMGQWMLMPVLDITSLNIDTLKRLANIFDKYADKPLRRIPEQFNPENPDPVRLGIDMEFLKTFRSELKDEEVKASLLELYKHVDASLKLWIKG